MPTWVIMVTIQIAFLLLAVGFVLWFMFRKNDPFEDSKKL